MSETNKQIRLAQRPQGMPGDDTWTLDESDAPTPGPDQFLVRNRYVSLDPAMRGWLRDARSYIEPVQIGDVMRAGAVGEVVSSNHAKFPVGAKVMGIFGVQQYALSDGQGVVVVDDTVAELPLYLATLGMPGMSAYFGLLDIGQPKEGETVVVSAASGAVGQVVGQIAKIKGCRVVGIAGGPAKCKWVVDELGFDACIDYKNQDVVEGLKQHCPDRIDVYFDNVGGDILDAVLARLALKARVVVCGAISQYNNTGPIRGPSNYLSLLVCRARMEGFVVFDYVPRYREAAMEMAGWLTQGKLRYKLDIDEGIENFPATLRKLFTGENFGKLLLAV
ncbi:NADP-dependent oxidoreductase [Haliangium sp.]|uniref:NADP-dependent oxidoreductase n=1 Tax=Haliangium sp. TaxID=2663208 RepID=UPI003D125E25